MAQRLEPTYHFSHLLHRPLDDTLFHAFWKTIKNFQAVVYGLQT